MVNVNTARVWVSAAPHLGRRSARALPAPAARAEAAVEMLGATESVRAAPPSPPRHADRSALPGGRVAAVTLRRARAHPAERVSARTGSVCARAAVCARQLRVCVCAREFCARPLRCSPAAAALPLARRCRPLYSRRRRRRPTVCARVRARAWPSRRQKSEKERRETREKERHTERG